MSFFSHCHDSRLLPAWIYLDGLLNIKKAGRRRRLNPQTSHIPLLTQPDLESVHWRRPVAYHEAKTAPVEHKFQEKIASKEGFE